jgi:Fe-S cluster assembly protein SufD
MNAQAKAGYLEAFAETSAVLAGNNVPWVRQARQQALSRFAEQGFPTTRDEDWRYTDVASVVRQPFKPVSSAARVPAAVLQPYLIPGLACHRLVFVNGYYAPERSSVDALPGGANLDGLARAIDRDVPGLEQHLGRYAPTDRYGFIALNTAFLCDGAYVHLSPGVDLGKPVHLIFFCTNSAQPILAQPRNLVIAERGSRLTLIESYVTEGENRCLTNAVTELVIGDNAVVEHYKLGLEGTQASHIGGLYVRQGAASHSVSHNLTFGGALTRNDINLRFDGDGSECILNGLYLAAGRQHVDNHTYINHARERCTSREFYKGILDGRGRGVFNGRITVQPHAQHTDALQENKNLLLSGDAEIDTKPQLEIYADDVKCAHGATVGQLDADALFYLRARGIDLPTARSVLTYAFAHDVLKRIPIDSVRSRVEQLLTTRLLAGRRIEELA